MNFRAFACYVLCLFLIATSFLVNTDKYNDKQLLTSKISHSLMHLWVIQLHVYGMEPSMSDGTAE